MLQQDEFTTMELVLFNKIIKTVIKNALVVATDKKNHYWCCLLSEERSSKDQVIVSGSTVSQSENSGVLSINHCLLATMNKSHQVEWWRNTSGLQPAVHIHSDREWPWACWTITGGSLASLPTYIPSYQLQTNFAPPCLIVWIKNAVSLCPTLPLAILYACLLWSRPTNTSKLWAPFRVRILNETCLTNLNKLY